MRKGPGFIARFFGRRDTNWLGFLAHRIRTPQPASKMGEFTLSNSAYKKLELRVLANMDFAAAAGRTLASVNADPRNHFGKHALRRFEK